VLTSQFDAASQGLAHSGFLRHQTELRPDDRLPVCFVDDGAVTGFEGFHDWFREHRPDVVIGRERSLLHWVERCAPETPCVQLHGGCEGFDAGIDPNAVEIAAAAVDCVVEKMRRFEKGIRESTRLHLIKGSWEERGLARRDAVTIVA
jgi:hypothetical protein